LSVDYAQQSLALQKQLELTTNTLLGVNLGTSDVDGSLGHQLATTFNSAIVPLCWREVEQHQGARDWSLSDRQVEWCRSAGLKICGGPLLQLDRSATPDWLYLWEGDFENLLTFVASYVQATVTRYRGKVHLWQCASRLNVDNVFSLTEEQRLRLAVLAIEATHQADPRAPIILTIDQPCAEFMSQSDCELSPLHFADALVRAEIGLSAIALELNIGYWPGGTSACDVLEFGRQIERWTMLGLPLLVLLTVPSKETTDPLARCKSQVVACGSDGRVSRESQRAWVECYLPMLLSKQPVQAILWNQLTDALPHDFAHGGLFDAQYRAKPALEVLRKLHLQYMV
jgi:hypothetical protein